MAKYIVNAKFIFSGIFEVEADSRNQARDIVINSCSLVMGGSIQDMTNDEVGWDFDIHPEKKIGRIIKKKSGSRISVFPSTKAK